jgi:hypothetical protein
MPDHICHPATGQAIELGPDETLQRIVWPEPPVVVLPLPGSAGALLYRLTRPSAKHGTRSGGCASSTGPLLLAPVRCRESFGSSACHRCLALRIRAMTSGLRARLLSVVPPSRNREGILMPRPGYLPHPRSLGSRLRGVVVQGTMVCI